MKIKDTKFKEAENMDRLIEEIGVAYYKAGCREALEEVKRLLIDKHWTNKCNIRDIYTDVNNLTSTDEIKQEAKE